MKDTDDYRLPPHDDYRRYPITRSNRAAPEPEKLPPFSEMIKQWPMRGIRNSHREECIQRKASDRLKTARKYKEAAQ